MTDPNGFPRLYARTQRFTLGAPRTITVSPDGATVLFLRSRHATDPVTCLWALDVADGVERLLADPRAIAEAEGLADDDELPEQERARRERTREQAGGIVGYTTDAAVRTIAFALSGRAYLVDVAGAEPPRPIPGATGITDPRVDPTGRATAFVRDGALLVHDGADARTDVLVEPETPGVRYATAEFIAAEEMNRARGFWWAPDGSALLVTRVDDTPVDRWYISDPANPGREPARIDYPAAGRPNAVVTVEIVGIDGARTPVRWNREAYEYVVDGRWDAHGPLLTVQSRDQREVLILAVDPSTGETTVLHSGTDPEWVDIVSGVPARLRDGSLVRAGTSDDTHRLFVDDVAITPVGLQVRGVGSVGTDSIVFTASEEPTSITVHRWTRDEGITLLSEKSGVAAAANGGETTVITQRGHGYVGAITRVARPGATHIIGSLAATPDVPTVEIFPAGPRGVRTAVILPRDHVPGTKLPILMDPYGGPHAQRVLDSSGMYLTSQWFADQGFGVVIVDGRGTPGRGPAFEREVAGDLAAPVLEDQIDGLRAAVERFEDLDPGRVGIRGWSFGGYLAALAVLREPDVFHTAIAGAPVTEWELYDTHYTERYLGSDTAAPSYRRSSLIPDAPALSRPLLLIHGLADDNVVMAHTLRLSGALLAAGRPHRVLPLTGATHMASDEVVAENLLTLQVEFLRSTLGIE
ncbi:S9 family peptidase [Millisia brevis]|uniref:S9 family peptidase n=1 Tax=Millisia brevis TaxID=264148 RepID=UPI00082EC42F|nr:prolyl oligopeptidase family serine peptidase [Millisia brevis]